MQLTVVYIPLDKVGSILALTTNDWSYPLAIENPKKRWTGAYLGGAGLP